MENIHCRTNALVIGQTVLVDAPHVQELKNVDSVNNARIIALLYLL